MVNYYEILLLLRPDITNESFDDIKSRIQTIIADENSGEIKNYDKWGKYLLAYPVKKCTYGVYTLIRFGIEEENAFKTLEKLRSLFTIRFNIQIMRHVIVNLGKTISEVYSRPDSFEDAPRRSNNRDGNDWNKNSRSNYSNNFNKKHNSESKSHEEDEDVIEEDDFSLDTHDTSDEKQI
jgi:small subunit ribosomal protein S6